MKIVLSVLLFCCAFVLAHAQTTVASVNNRIMVDGNKYALNAAGIQNAVNDAQSNGSREVWLPCGTININATINITHGGFRLIGCGSGFTDTGSTPTTMLQWTGSAGSDMISILGTASNRLDAVSFEHMILDGGNSARYTLRSEKIDNAELYQVRLRNGATASFYAVDATGWKWRSTQLSQCPSYCAVFDWATGGFSWVGGNMDILLANSNPGIFFQGASNGLSIKDVEFDASGPGAFAGYIQINGFDTNSAFASAPTGGAGAPISFICDSCKFYMHSSSNAPSQGADVLVTGTAAHPSQNVSITNSYFDGLSVSAASVKVDRGNNVVVDKTFSKGHTTSSLVLTANIFSVSMEHIPANNADGPDCTGTGCGAQVETKINTNGRIASLGGYECFGAAGCQLGNPSVPFADGFFGNAANQAFHWTVSGLTAVRALTVQDASGTVGLTSGTQRFVAGCNGTATNGASTDVLAWPGGATTACTNTNSNLRVTMATGGTARNLAARCNTAGLNGSSGAMTLVKNGSATSLTCTIGTGTNCTDTTHTVSFSANDSMFLQFVSQASETLADCTASFEVQ
jgi:hypothetical protein